MTVAAVARQIGVAPATLRTWDRRYGIGPTQHSAGAHRRYSPEDVARLEYMRRLVISGIPPADAARAAQESEVDVSPRATVTPIRRGIDEGQPTSRAGGGQVVALPGGLPAARGLARAAQTLDTHACVAIIGDSVDKRGVVWTWENLLVPVLVAVGERWRDTGRGVEIEHALSGAVQEALTIAISRLTNPVNSRAVLLTSGPDEMHTLPLWGISAALAEEGIASRILGGRMPADSMVQAIQRTGPAAVFVWAQVPETADYTALAAIPAFRPPVAVIVGGPGWSKELPDSVVSVDCLTSAVAQIARALGE